MHPGPTFLLDQSQMISSDNLFNCAFQRQRSSSNVCLGLLLLARWNQIFDHVLGHWVDKWQLMPSCSHQEGQTTSDQKKRM
jgi:hypothetical protein